MKENSEDKMIELSWAKVMMLVCKEIMEQKHSFTNKSFNPRDLDECIDTMQKILDEKDLSKAWFESAVTAIVNGCPIYMDYNEARHWVLLYGKPGQDYASFLKAAKEAAKAMEKGDVTVTDRRRGKKSNQTQFGKDYFKKK